MSAAKVKIWDCTVGFISWDERKQSMVFELDKNYLNAPFNLSPVIDDSKNPFQYGHDYHQGFQGVIPVLNDSLPDSFGDKVFIEWLNSTQINKAELNPVERLLYVGKRGMGAIEYELEKQVPSLNSKISINDLASVSNQILQGKLDANTIEAGHALRNILSYGSSAVGGAQAKVLLAERENGQFFPGDVIHPNVENYYVVKLTTTLENPWLREKNRVEFCYNQMAKSTGINVAASKLISEGDYHHFASKRFDRINGEKIHVQTANALTGFFDKKTPFSYETLFRIIDGLGMPYQDREQLYKQMVFNVVGGNRDDHTKNFSFTMNKQGVWRLSEAYDITFPYNPYESYFSVHQITINGKRNKINVEDLLSVAKLVGVNKAKSIIQETITVFQNFPQKALDNGISLETTKRIFEDIKNNIAYLKLEKS